MDLGNLTSSLSSINEQACSPSASSVGGGEAELQLMASDTCHQICG